MVEVWIDFPETRIMVCGFEFVLLKSDGDILHDSIAIGEKYKDLDVTNLHELLAYCEEAKAYIDSVLGEGALAKISRGRAVGTLKIQECMRVIAEAVGRAYADGIEEKYPVDEDEPAEDKAP